MRTLKALFFIVIMSLNISCKDDTQKLIIEAVDMQIMNYPESTLIDIYKNFFQDYYGPGHIINDSRSARNYLSSELETVENYSLASPVEAVGYRHNFIRLDIYLIKSGKISFEEFLDAFLKSAEYFREPELGDWEQEWNTILKVIERANYNIPGIEEDKIELQEMLDAGHYVVHHSRKYIQNYDPHYRIVEREIFENDLSKLLE